MNGGSSRALAVCSARFEEYAPGQVVERAARLIQAAASSKPAAMTARTSFGGASPSPHTRTSSERRESGSGSKVTRTASSGAPCASSTSRTTITRRRVVPRG